MLLGISVRDVLDQSNELFKEDVAGDDFLLEVLRLMNMIKKRLEFQEMLQQFNITSIYKKKDHIGILITIVVCSESPSLEASSIDSSTTTATIPLMKT